MKTRLRTLLLAAALQAGAAHGAELQLLDVSYDPTREFFAEVNARFAAEWQRSTGQTLPGRGPRPRAASPFAYGRGGIRCSRPERYGRDRDLRIVRSRRNAGPRPCVPAWRPGRTSGR